MSTVDCDRCRELLAGRLYGDLAAEEETLLAAHLRECAGCASLFEEMRKASRLLDEWRLEAAPVPALSGAGLDAREEKASRRPRSSRARAVRRGSWAHPSFRTITISLAAAAALVLAAALFAARSRPASPGGAPETLASDLPGATTIAPAPDSVPAAQEGGERAPSPVATDSPAAAEDEEGVASRTPGGPGRAPAPTGRAPADETDVPALVARLPSAPRDGATTGRLGVVTVTEGPVEYSRARTERWFPARQGTSLLPGDRLRTKFSRARLALESGGLFCVNRFTTLAFGEKAGPPAVWMVGGEIYVETAPADKGLLVETPHGRACDLGTRFGLSVKNAGTTVVVVEGKVRASTQAGEAEVSTGQEVVLARWTSPPGPVRETRDLERRLAWALSSRTSVAAEAPAKQEPAVTSFSLVDTRTGKPIRGLEKIENGAVIVLSRLPTSTFNICANTEPADAGHVVFQLDDKASYAERCPPYELFGDAGVKVTDRSRLGRGEHRLTATPFSGAFGGHESAGTGEPGRSLTIRFRVVERLGR